MEGVFSMGVFSEIDLVQKEKLMNQGDHPSSSPKSTVFYEESWRILCNNGFGRGEAKRIAVNLVKKHGSNAADFAASMYKMEDKKDECEDNGD